MVATTKTKALDINPGHKTHERALLLGCGRGRAQRWCLSSEVPADFMELSAVGLVRNLPCGCSPEDKLVDGFHRNAGCLGLLPLAVPWERQPCKNSFSVIFQGSHT